MQEAHIRVSHQSECFLHQVYPAYMSQHHHPPPLQLAQGWQCTGTFGKALTNLTFDGLIWIKRDSPSTHISILDCFNGRAGRLTAESHVKSARRLTGQGPGMVPSNIPSAKSHSRADWSLTLDWPEWTFLHTLWHKHQLLSLITVQVLFARWLLSFFKK